MRRTAWARRRMMAWAYKRSTAWARRRTALARRWRWTGQRGRKERIGWRCRRRRRRGQGCMRK
jgi:hypothetical protein